MRTTLLLAAALFLAVPVRSQQRYLVSPKAEVIPLSPDESAAEVVKARSLRSLSSDGICPDKFVFGYSPDAYTINSNFGSYHRDVLGEWFTAPASGTIDSIFWSNRALVGAYDSTVYLRVHRSNIGPAYGPGARPGPFNPPCQNWGYWQNTNDLDQQVAAFIEDATDTAWVSTINGTSLQTTPPFGEELWGLGGFAVRIRPNSVGVAAMADLAAPITIATGDRFFISLRVAHEADSSGGHREQDTGEHRTEWNSSGFRVRANDDDYPSRNWKFYEHDKGPSNCAGMPIDSIRKGWVARGGYGNDSLDVAVFNIWYVMSVVSNVPPVISDDGRVHTAISFGPWNIDVEISDCNPENPSNAGVDSAFIEYTVNDVPQSDVPMVNTGGLFWSGSIPAQTYGVRVRYRIKAVDKDGAIGTSSYDEFRAVALWNQWYTIDTSGSCVHQDIRATGTRIPRSAYFGPPWLPGANDLDNGTAGPFDMGGDVVVFGDTFRYAWVGIDGGISLSRGALDTVDVNANGNYGYLWDFPSRTYAGRDNPSAVMPRMFIAPFWNDLILEWSSPSQSTPGVIIVGSGGDSCLFIVEWDSMSSVATLSASGIYTSSDFRVVVNRCTGTIEFQYDIVESGIDSTALVGMQLDTSSVDHPNPYLLINRHVYPFETIPRNNWCVKMTPSAPLSVSAAAAAPTEFALSQNYPNRFNPSTVIIFSLPFASDVRLEVFNVVGQRVALLVNDRIGPGTHQAVWSAPEAASGLYFCRLETRAAGNVGGNTSFMRKMLLMR